jgi:lysophospholipase L1-like esterase
MRKSTDAHPGRRDDDRLMIRRLCRSALVVLILAGVPAAAAPAAVGHPAPRYHLALGDSIPYGFTTAKALAGLPPSEFSGYPDPVSDRLHLTTVNYACPGETTATFISGPCGWRQAGFRLHDDYPGGQLAAAEEFLRRQAPGAGGLITLTLWGNDLRLFLASCPDPQCVIDRAPAEIAAFGQRLQQAVSRLRAAAPRARIVILGAYALQFTGLDLADRLIGALNATIAQVADANGAAFADPVPVFNPPGGIEARRAALCTLTLLCTENDSHPTAAGQEALAELVLNAWP